MTKQVDPTQIERLVGARRHQTQHLARLRGDAIYLLHSAECLERHDDLRRCPYSLALDNEPIWDQPVRRMWDHRRDLTLSLELEDGSLIPTAVGSAASARLGLELIVPCCPD